MMLKEDVFSVDFHNPHHKMQCKRVEESLYLQTIGKRLEIKLFRFQIKATCSVMTLANIFSC
jgi:hypothetical protein